MTRTRTVIVLVVLAGLTLIPAAGASALPPVPVSLPDLDGEFDAATVLVGFEDGADADAVHADAGVGEVATRIAEIDVDVVSVAPGTVAAAIAAYEAEEGVAYAEPNWQLELLDQHPDDPYLDQQYQMEHIRAVPGWAAYNAAVADRHGAEAWAPSGGATLAILDTGLDLTHPEFDGKVVDCATYLTTTGFRGPGCQEANFHGTYVAGIAAAITNNDEGIAGVGFDADLMIYQVCTYFCFTADSAAAMVDAAVRGADVANYSFGGASPSATSRRAVEFAHAQGVFQVSSAGNSGEDGADTVTYPAAYEVVMAVGATDRDRKRADFSSIGPEVEVTAPGVGIMSTFTGGGLLYVDTFSGTSFSGPAVAGLGALLRNLGLGHDEARQVIVDAADPDAVEANDEDHGRPFEERYGAGMADVEASVLLALDRLAGGGDRRGGPPQTPPGRPRR